MGVLCAPVARVIHEITKSFPVKGFDGVAFRGAVPL
ncbi:MAG: hypothetical protein ACJAZF_004373, partial [Granulosicoccus sp.]